MADVLSWAGLTVDLDYAPSCWIVSGGIAADVGTTMDALRLLRLLRLPRRWYFIYCGIRWSMVLRLLGLPRLRHYSDLLTLLLWSSLFQPN